MELLDLLLFLIIICGLLLQINVIKEMSYYSIFPVEHPILIKIHWIYPHYNHILYKLYKLYHILVGKELVNGYREYVNLSRYIKKKNKHSNKHYIYLFYSFEYTRKPPPRIIRPNTTTLYTTIHSVQVINCGMPDRSHPSWAFRTSRLPRPAITPGMTDKMINAQPNTRRDDSELLKSEPNDFLFVSAVMINRTVMAMPHPLKLDAQSGIWVSLSAVCMVNEEQMDPGSLSCYDRLLPFSFES